MSGTTTVGRESFGEPVAVGRAPRVQRSRYTIAETWDSPVQEHPVYLMCGTSLERDNVLINPHAIIGYPTGLQADSIHLRLVYPVGWKIGTALVALRHVLLRAMKHAIKTNRVEWAPMSKWQSYGGRQEAYKASELQPAEMAEQEEAIEDLETHIKTGARNLRKHSPHRARPSDPTGLPKNLS